MTFVQAIQSGFNNYVKFTGRASRSEFWYWTLFVILIGLIPNMMSRGETIGGTMGLWTSISSLISLGLLLPNLGMAVRRLHDRNMSGWWYLIAFTIIGIVVLIVWFCLPGTSGPNKHGEDPLSTPGTVAKTFE